MLEWSDSGKKWSLFEDNEMHQPFKLMRLYRNLNMSLKKPLLSKKLFLAKKILKAANSVIVPRLLLLWGMSIMEKRHFLMLYEKQA